MTHAKHTEKKVQKRTPKKLTYKPYLVRPQVEIHPTTVTFRDLKLIVNVLHLPERLGPAAEKVYSTDKIAT